MLQTADNLPFEERKLDPKVAEKLGARFEAGKFQFDYLEDDGSLWSRKFRSHDKSKWWFEPAGRSLRLWGLDAVPLFESRPDVPLVITEGEFDRIAAVQVLGDEAFVVSVPNGSAGKRSEGTIKIAEDERFAYLWQGEKLHPKVEQFNKVVLMVDGDAAGQILRDELAMRIGPARCWHVTYPKGAINDKPIKDANDALIAYGPRAIELIFKRAQPMRPGYLVSPYSLPQRASSQSYLTGLPFLDDHVRIVRPELMIVTGMPGHGKGQFLRCLAAHMAEKHGWRFAFLVPEDRYEIVRLDWKRFALRNVDQSSEALREKAHAEATAWVDHHFKISTPPEDDAITMDMVIGEMEAAALHFDCQGFVLDPWNEVQYEPLSGESETKNVERLLVMIKQKMRRLNLFTAIAAHPRKPTDKGPPDLYSISGSANWFNKADHGISVFRPSFRGPGTQFVIGKAKVHETMGVPGSAYANFIPSKCDYVAAEVPPPRQRGDNGVPAAEVQEEEEFEPMQYDGYGAVT
jgi:twinkle protein